MTLSKDKSIGSASVRLSKKLTRFLNGYLKSFNITTEQWSVLRTLNERDHITQKELSVRADKDQATLTKILDLLEKNKFVERIKNSTDRRSFIVKITEEGRELTEKVLPFLEEIFEKITDQIEADKLAIYQEVILSLEESMNSILEGSE